MGAATHDGTVANGGGLLVTNLAAISVVKSAVLAGSGQIQNKLKTV